MTLKLKTVIDADEDDYLKSLFTSSCQLLAVLCCETGNQGTFSFIYFKIKTGG